MIHIYEKSGFAMYLETITRFKKNKNHAIYKINFKMPLEIYFSEHRKSVKLLFLIICVEITEWLISDSNDRSKPQGT